MATQKPVLKSIDQFMADYRPVYQPILPLFLPRSAQYNEEVGKLNFKRIDAVGDIRAKHITPKDTEIRQLAVNESSKTFKKYFLANQFVMSEFQDQGNVADVTAQVLDEHWKQSDELFLLGEGTSNSTMINNALFHSADANYVLENSVAIDDDDRLYDFHNKVIVNATKANLVSGRKIVMFYGTDVLPLYNSLYTTAVVPFKRALGDVLGSNYSTMELPAAITPANVSGWIIVNMDQVKLHYTKLPGIHKQGVNDEKNYAWWNFLHGSMMLDVLASGAVIRQPATLASPD